MNHHITVRPNEREERCEQTEDEETRRRKPIRRPGRTGRILNTEDRGHNGRVERTGGFFFSFLQRVRNEKEAHQEKDFVTTTQPPRRVVAERYESGTKDGEAIIEESGHGTSPHEDEQTDFPTNATQQDALQRRKPNQEKYAMKNMKNSNRQMYRPHTRSIKNNKMNRQAV